MVIKANVVGAMLRLIWTYVQRRRHSHYAKDIPFANCKFTVQLLLCDTFDILYL